MQVVRTAEMIFNTAYSQFYGAAQDDTQEHLWHHMSK
jgi:hypothetical protein